MIFVLAQFDARVGNKVVWMSHPAEAENLPGIEYKMIPSGLHERSHETIYFVCGSWNGVARFEVQLSEHDPSGREGLRMYSLAVLSPTTEGLPWNQEAVLKTKLADFLEFDCDKARLPKSPLAYLDPTAHPILLMPKFLEIYGPTVFGLWKAGLVRSRVILASIPGQTIRSMCCFTYIAAQISSIPSDVQHLLPDQKPPVSCIYNTTLIDLRRLQSAESFWATTTDGLLLSSSRDACDIFAEKDCLRINDGRSSGTKQSPTWRDRQHFSTLVDALKLQNISKSSGFVESLIDSTTSGLLWWASGGESAIFEREESAPLLESQSIQFSHDAEPISDGIALVGQFQQYTRQLIRVLAQLAREGNSSIKVSIQDIAAMGLDPFAQTDREFLQRFANVWFNMPVKILNTYCCCL